MKKRLLFLLLLFIWFFPSLGWGQAKVGTAGAQFLEIGVSARAVGMGEAFLGVVDDAAALYYNPGGMTQLNKKEILLTHIEYPADINYEFVGLVYPAPQFGGVWGLAFYMLNAGDMPLRTFLGPGMDSSSSTGLTFSAKEYALGLSYARNLTDRFSVGVTLKGIVEQYEEEKASGWALDMGTLYNTGFKGFKIAMVLSNFGPDLKFIQEAYPLPMNFKFGGSMEVLNRGNHKAIFSLEGSHPNDNLEKFNAGLEYSYRNFFSLRLGQKFQYDSGDFSVGGGVKFPFSKYTLKVDYGYFHFGFLENVHRFSLGLSF